MRTWVLVLAIALMLPAPARASSAAGLEIELGRFKLQVFYSVALDYADRADASIRDPRSALFTLASALQANAEAFAAIPHTVRVEIFTREGDADTFVLGIEDPQGRGTVLVEDVVARDVAARTVAVLCDRYAAACRNPTRGHLVLYRCPERGCRGRIRFGAFSSDSLNDRFAVLPQKRAAATPVAARRREMTEYFAALD